MRFLVRAVLWLRLGRGAVKVPARVMRARARYFIGVLSADYLYLLGNSMEERLSIGQAIAKLLLFL